MSTAKELFERRRQRTRAKLRKSNNDQPRLCVHRSSKHIYAQVMMTQQAQHWLPHQRLTLISN